MDAEEGRVNARHARENAAVVTREQFLSRSEQLGAYTAGWRSGRPGKADNALSRMVRDGKLRRMKLKDERGSRYSAA